MNKIFLFLLFIFLFGCIEEIEVFKGSSESLVIDGTITNGPGPQSVKISYSRQFNTKASYENIAGAIVSIVDDEGVVEPMVYQENGHFETSAAFHAITGRSYQIKIKLESGDEYESLPEKCVAVPPVDNFSAKLNGTQIDFYVDFKDNAEEKNYYRWRYRGTFEFIAPVAYEMSRTNQRMKNGDCISWDGPLPYAKDIYKCWIGESDPEYMNVDDDLLFDGRELKDLFIYSMELSRKFDRGYYAEVRQYSMTKEAYTYWKAIKDQMGNNGTIFETSNYQIKGNLRSVQDPNEVVLGYFGVSSVDTKSVFVGEYMGLFGELPCEINNSGCYPERCMDCRRAASTATTTKPDFWPY
jgi:hypothetical protein